MTRFCLHLTDEQMIEIGRARDRLMDYKRKIQPYDLPPEPVEPAPQVIEHRHYNIPEQGYVKYLQEKLAEKEKRKPKASGYKGIK